MHYNEDAEVSPVANTSQKFTCSYSKLWCTCSTGNIRETPRSFKDTRVLDAGTGCTVGCAHTKYFVLTNQSYCNYIKDFVLTGFIVE